ncbi:SRPBCC domain-containing protein [Sphingomonas canadensis]|uniref:SRPBCC domain-containing protein n=1 Tax=Sphingomonas canadensis TaxID=1219257 RepID=A0ABW3H5T6_9SPHN|nr:SRPBCC domain-containing protein [Sphingomonas canadensis]MCW3835338.1 SRPBCC domain-containing protein [Sphingomonas canadensis]
MRMFPAAALALIAVLPLRAPPAAAQTVTEADGTRTMAVDALIPAAPDAVWQALATAEGWRSWAVPAAWFVAPDLLETSYDPAAKPGDAGNIRQQVVARLPGRLIVFRNVKTPPGFPHAAEFAGVTQFLELAPEGEGTRVRLTGTGYPAGAVGDALLGFFEPGNRMTLDLLAGRFRLAPLDFLAGHCWEGALPNGDRNRHCFDRQPGKLRDRHQVFRQGAEVYGGETIYAWDAAAGAIGFVYSSGGKQVGRGHVRAIPGGLDFGTADYGSGDGKVTIATRWMRAGAGAYDAVDSAPAAPAFDRTTRYTRVE